jgi:hypothetical protein
MYTTLDEIIKSLLVQLEVNGEHQYMRFFELARTGLRELNFDTAKHVKTALLTINKSTYSAPLPADYVSYTRIGIYNQDGTIDYMARLDNLYTGSATPIVQEDVTDVDNDPPVFKDGLSLGKQFGKGGGQNRFGYYRENKIARTLEFNSGITVSEVVVEYITDGIDNVDSSSNVQVHSFLAEALKAYIYYAHIKYKRDYTATDKDMAKKDFYNLKRLSRARVQGMTKDEALVQSRKHFRQAPKY